MKSNSTVTYLLTYFGLQIHFLAHHFSPFHYWKTEICLVFNGLPSANRQTLGKELVCRVLDPGALGKPKALGKITICRVSTLGKEIHSVNDHFA